MLKRKHETMSNLAIGLGIGFLKLSDNISPILLRSRVDLAVEREFLL